MSRSPDDGPVQPGLNCLLNFPKSHGRRFAPEWYKKYPCSEYSACQDKVYCSTCRHFSTIVDKSAACPFITEGFDQWEKCTGANQKDNRLTKHKNSLLHLDSSVKYKAYMETKLSEKTITILLNDHHRQFVKRNLEYIKVIVDTL